MERDLHFKPQMIKDVSELKDRGFETEAEAEAEIIEPKPEPTRGGQVVSRRPHKAEIVGSTPTPATITELREIQGRRTEKSQSADMAQEHSTVISPTSPQVEEWIEDPGSMDVKGIDTPPAKKARKPRKPKAEVKKERKPRAKSKAKSKAEKPEGKRLLKGELLEIQEGRSERSQSSDLAREHSVVVPVTSRRTRTWSRKPGSMDVQGIDTPRKKKAKRGKKSSRAQRPNTSMGGLR